MLRPWQQHVELVSCMLCASCRAEADHQLYFFLQELAADNQRYLAIGAEAFAKDGTTLQIRSLSVRFYIVAATDTAANAEDPLGWLHAVRDPLPTHASHGQLQPAPEVAHSASLQDALKAAAAAQQLQIGEMEEHFIRRFGNSVNFVVSSDANDAEV